MGKRLLTDEQHSYFVANQKGKMAKDIAKEMNDVFGLSLTDEQIKNLRSRNKIHSGLTGRFEKGQVPFNKGKKFPGTANRTSFKKGHKPINYLPVGSERFDKDGYVKIKVANPNIWRLKHRVIWEAANGPVPKTHAIVFKNQNKHDIRLDNLMMIKRSELSALNKKHVLGTNPEINEVNINVVRIEQRINEIKRKGNKK